MWTRFCFAYAIIAFVGSLFVMFKGNYFCHFRCPQSMAKILRASLMRVLHHQRAQHTGAKAGEHCGSLLNLKNCVSGSLCAFRENSHCCGIRGRLNVKSPFQTGQSLALSRGKPAVFNETLETAFHYTASYSTRPDRRRVKSLMIATYVSAAIGCILLTAVGFRVYGRFKKRARGIEELDVPQFGRRSRVLCRYRGYVLVSDMIDTIVNDIPWFQVRPDDTWVISYPKAGKA